MYRAASLMPPLTGLSLSPRTVEHGHAVAILADKRAFWRRREVNPFHVYGKLG
jgi:hypothetical protein